MIVIAFGCDRCGAVVSREQRRGQHQWGGKPDWLTTPGGWEYEDEFLRCAACASAGAQA